MTTMTRQNWTDERLDERFDHLDGEIGTLRVEVREMRTELRTVERGLRDEIRGVETALGAQIRGVETALGAQIRVQETGLRGELSALNRTLIRIGFGFAIALVVILVTAF